MQQPHALLIIGSAGNGKSALGNRVRSVEGTAIDAFRESDDTESETMSTVVKQGSYEGVPVEVMDTPGLSDSNGMDAAHLTEMVATIKRNRVHGISLTFNAQADRFDDNIKRMIRLLWNLFGSTLEIWIHVCLVFTKCFAAVPINKQQKRTKYSNCLQQILQECNQGATFPATIPCFFVDSKDRNNQDSNSDLSFLIGWLNSREVINSNLLVVVNVNFFKIDLETETVVLFSNTTPITHVSRERTGTFRHHTDVLHIDGYKTIVTKQKRTREVRTLYDGKTITYSDWNIDATWTE